MANKCFSSFFFCSSVLDRLQNILRCDEVEGVGKPLQKKRKESGWWFETHVDTAHSFMDRNEGCTTHFRIPLVDKEQTHRNEEKKDVQVDAEYMFL